MEYKPSFADQLYIDIQPSYSDSLMHHGIKGQKWGVRRFQNPDGSLTERGRKRYAVRESKGSFLDANRTFMNSDLKRANEMGGTKNRDAVVNQVDKAIANSREVNAAENECRKTAREGYAAYAELYNKHAKELGINDRLNPKTFNWYNQMNELDWDVDGAVWDDRSKEAIKFYDIQDKHEANVDRWISARNSVAQPYVDEYNKAVLRDIPNDGSNQAKQRILKKYGTNANQLASNSDYDYDDNDRDYGWGVYNLFDA